MQRVRQRVVDDVDLGVVDRVLVGGDDPFDTVVVGERRGPLADRVRRPRQSRPSWARPDDRRLGDPCGAEDADPQGFHERDPVMPGREEALQERRRWP